MAPSDTAPVGVLTRDPGTGRFLVGNAAAVGHIKPQEGRMAVLRQALLDAITPQDIVDVAAVLVSEAKAGNVFAASLLFDRTMGKVKAAEPEQSQAAVALIEQLWRDAGVRLDEPREVELENS